VTNFTEKVRAVFWERERLVLLDQRQLPEREIYLDVESAEQAAGAIRDMVVRGAPAIGIAAAYAVVLAARARYAASAAGWRHAIEADLAGLNAARPTAVNLHWALERMRKAVGRAPSGAPESFLLAEARAIHEEDIAANRRMGELGAALIAPGSGVLTHCNTGALATGGFGTALGVIRAGAVAGRISKVYADETRPWLQGARLTAWELVKEGIGVTLIADSAAALLMQRGAVQWVIVGADRIAANGDTANKIGTYALAVLARAHGVKFMVVAPTSTVDPATASGDGVPIEQRDAGEVLSFAGRRVAAPGAQAENPVFDVTPARLIDALVTERGALPNPDAAGIRILLSSGRP
jgi:methylthioribose-1-phosphate isomerase